MGSGVALDQLSVPEGGALDDPAFAVESDEVAGFFAVLQLDDHLELAVVVVVALLALRHTLAVKSELLLERSIRPIPKEFADVHAVLPTSFFVEAPLVVIQPVIAKRNST